MTVEEYLRFTPDMTDEEKLKKINRSRNYIRFKIIMHKDVDIQHPLLTEAERLILRMLQDNRTAVNQARFTLLTNFYDQSPVVGSTIKRKVRKEIENLTDLSTTSFADDTWI